MVILVALLLVLSAHGAVAKPCPCDCDTDYTVRVSELMTGVNISFDRLKMSRCPAADADADGEVSVSDLVAGVGAALNGCPQHPFPSPTPVPRLTEVDLAAARARWDSTGIGGTSPGVTNATPRIHSVSVFIRPVFWR